MQKNGNDYINHNFIIALINKLHYKIKPFTAIYL